MARGISIKDVENKVQNISDNNVLPISTGADVPEVVEVGTLKEHIQEGLDFYEKPSAGIPKSDLAADVRTSLGKADTALQSFTETDPTVPAWAKQSSKPSYSYSEITGKPNLSAVATSGSYNDLTNKPDIPTVPTNVSAFTNDAGYLTEHQDISGKANSNDLATVAFSGDYEDLENTPTIPDVPEWAMASTKPSYTVSEISGAQEELVSGTTIKTVNGESVLGSGNITIQGGGGDVNVIESISFNGNAVPVDGSKNAAITYTAPVTSVNGNTGAVTLSIPDAQVQSDWNATTGMGVILNKPTIPTVPTISTNITTDGSDDTKTASPKAVKTFVEGKGYLTSETEPDFNGSAAAGITSSDITAWNGKADKSEMSVSTSGDQTTITLKSGTSATVINQHQSLSGYVQTSSTAGLIKNDGTIDTTSYGTYSKPSGGIPASDIAGWVLPSAVTDKSVGDLGYTKNEGTVTGAKVNNVMIEDEDGVLDIGTVVTDVSGKASWDVYWRNCLCDS